MPPKASKKEWTTMRLEVTNGIELQSSLTRRYSWFEAYQSPKLCPHKPVLGLSLEHIQAIDPFVLEFLSKSYQPKFSFAGIPANSEPKSPRHVAIWVELPYVPLT